MSNTHTPKPVRDYKNHYTTTPTWVESGLKPNGKINFVIACNDCHVQIAMYYIGTGQSFQIADYTGPEMPERE